MFLLCFLDAYISMIKNVQIVPLDIFINWYYSLTFLHQDVRLNQKYQKYWKYYKAKTCRQMKKKYWRLGGYKIIISESYQNYLFDKREPIKLERVEVNSLKFAHC